jgi:hypothetical protein
MTAPASYCIVMQVKIADAIHLPTFPATALVVMAFHAANIRVTCPKNFFEGCLVSTMQITPSHHPAGSHLRPATFTLPACTGYRPGAKGGRRGFAFHAAQRGAGCFTATGLFAPVTA